MTRKRSLVLPTPQQALSKTCCLSDAAAAGLTQESIGLWTEGEHLSCHCEVHIWKVRVDCCLHSIAAPEVLKYNGKHIADCTYVKTDGLPESSIYVHCCMQEARLGVLRPTCTTKA